MTPRHRVTSESIASRISVVHDDITQVAVDAIVNAANSSLRGGGGVDGAIHHAAGPKLLEECIRIGGCPTGDARVTKGYDLPASFVIHAVGPIWRGGAEREPELLRSAYDASLRLATAVGARIVAFPCISTGVYGYPKPEACEIAVRAVAQWLLHERVPEKVVFCCFEEEDYHLYQRRLAEHG